MLCWPRVHFLEFRSESTEVSESTNAEVIPSEVHNSRRNPLDWYKEVYEGYVWYEGNGRTKYKFNDQE